jgi:cytochrome c oxidase subunit II
MKHAGKHCLRILLLLSFAPAAMAGTDSSPQRFHIAAKRFSFEPGQIAVEDNRTVILQLTSEDVTHGLKSKDFNFNVAIHKGQTTEVTFTPHRAGRFIARCSHFCGVGHGSMILVIDVVDK